MAEPSWGIVYSSIRQAMYGSPARARPTWPWPSARRCTENLVAVRFANAMPTGQGLLSADIKIAWAHDFSGVTLRWLKPSR